MTRGTDANLAFVFTTPARPADPQPGTRPAPELDRYERIRRERAGYPPTSPFAARSRDQADQREPIAVLADVLGRDGAELSASAIRQRNLANADHLAILQRDLDRRNQSRPPRPLPRARPGRAPARPPAAPVASGPVAVPHPARRRTGRPGPRRGHRHGHRLPGPGRSPRHRRRPGRPDPAAHPPAPSPAARPLGRTSTPTCPTPTATPT